MNGSVRLTWDEPASYAEPQIDTIHARWKEKGGKWTEWKDLGEVGSYTVTGLDNGTLYRFQVRAAGPGGEGEASDTASAKPQPKPAPPRHLIANAADASVILHWDISPDDSLNEYRYRVREAAATAAWKGGWQEIPRREDPPNHPGYYAPGGLSDVTVTALLDGTRLANGTRYMFQVRARNGNGWGKPSETAYATPAAAPAAPQAVTVAHDWALIPEDADGDPLAGPGESFRLLFVTGAATAATSTDINRYNAFVQERANAVAGLRPFKDGFRAVISTAAANARDNIGNDPDVPVYWTGGGMVVGGPYSDGLFEDEWIDRTPRDEAGKASTATRAWTGSDRSGHSWSWGNTVGTRFYAGAPHVWTGNPSGGVDHRGDPSGQGGISYPTWGSMGKPPAATTQLPLYGISPVITVQGPPPSTVWSATLTVDSGSAVGCRTGSGWPHSMDDCSDTDVLTEDGFTHAGTAYTVEAVFWDRYASRKLLFGVAGVTPADAKTALAGTGAACRRRRGGDVPRRLRRDGALLHGPLLPGVGRHGRHQPGLEPWRRGRAAAGRARDDGVVAAAVRAGGGRAARALRGGRAGARGRRRHRGLRGDALRGVLRRGHGALRDPRRHGEEEQGLPPGQGHADLRRRRDVEDGLRAGDRRRGRRGRGDVQAPADEGDGGGDRRRRGDGHDRERRPGAGRVAGALRAHGGGPGGGRGAEPPRGGPEPGLPGPDRGRGAAGRDGDGRGRGRRDGGTIPSASRSSRRTSAAPSWRCWRWRPARAWSPTRARAAR